MLELPIRTIYSSLTQPGDPLVICSVEELETNCAGGAATCLTMGN
jgi:hypothetical protein